MTIDRVEANRRGQSPRKPSAKHPYAAIEHRVIDSPAFADMKPTAQVLLLLIARQLTKDNNGHLQAAFKYMQRFGIGSEHTLRDAIAELLAHGFIYRTRSHGANKAWAKYAVTWLPIKQRDGLFLDAFKSCAWHGWSPSEKKSSRQKAQEQSGRNCSFTLNNPAETAGSRGAETADYELMPCSSDVSALSSGATEQQTRSPIHQSVSGDWIPAYIHRITSHGLAHACPVTIQ